MRNTIAVFAVICSLSGFSYAGANASRITGDRCVAGAEEMPQDNRGIVLTEENVWEKLDEKAVWFQEGLEVQSDLNDLPAGFLDFYTKFSTDSIFQKEHVDFARLIGVIGECEASIILTKDNWEFQADNIIDDFNETGDAGSSEMDDDADDSEIEELMIRYFFAGDDKILFEYEIEEIGIVYRIGFEKINGTWKETLYQLDVC